MDRSFIDALATAFAKEFGGRADPILEKKVKDIRDEVARALGTIAPGSITTEFTGNIDLSSILSPSISHEAYKKNLNIRMQYDKLTRALLLRIKNYVSRTSNLFTGQINITSPIKEILGGDKKISLWTSHRYNALTRKLLGHIGKYINAQGRNLFEGKINAENAVRSILNVDPQISLWTSHRFNHLARKLLNQITRFVTHQGRNLFEGKVDINDAVASVLNVDKKFSLWTQHRYNHLTRKLLWSIGRWIDRNQRTFISGSVDAADIIPTVLGDAESSLWTQHKFNKVRRKLLASISKFIDHDLVFNKDPVNALDLLDIRSGSLYDRASVRDGRINTHKTFFSRLDDFILNDLKLTAPTQDVIGLLNIHASGFIDRSGLKKGFKETIRVFFDKLKAFINSDKIKFKTDYSFDPLEFVALSDTDKKNLHNKYLSAVKRYLNRIIHKLEHGIINLKALELPDHLGAQIGKVITDKIKETNVSIKAVGLINQNPDDTKSPYMAEERVFDDKITKTMIVGVDNKAIDFERIFCGCINKLAVKFDDLEKAIKNIKITGSSESGGLGSLLSGVAGVAAAAMTGVNRAAKTGTIAKALPPKKLPWWRRAGSWVGNKLSSIGKSITNSLSSAKRELFSKLSKFVGGVKGYVKYIFKIPIINTALAALFAGIEIQDIINNDKLSQAQKEQAIGVVVIKNLGMLLGGTVGAVLLTPIPGGTILGGILGSFAGQYIGEWIGNNIDARTMGRLIIDIFGINLGITSESVTSAERTFENTPSISSSTNSTSGITSTDKIPKIATDYSPVPTSSNKTAVSAINTGKNSDTIKSLNKTVQTLNKAIEASSSPAIIPNTSTSGGGNSKASASPAVGDFREPAYNIRISAWSRLRPGSLIA